MTQVEMTRLDESIAELKNLRTSSTDKSEIEDLLKRVERRIEEIRKLDNA